MMSQGKPRFGPIIKNINDVARSLGVNPEEITKTSLRPQIVSTGLNQLMVPIKSLETLANLQPDFPLVKQLEESFGFLGCSVFTFETISPEASVHVRFFAPSVGVWEDPATGSAAGGLGAYLLRWKALPLSKEPLAFIIEQGYEIRRPSTIYVEVQHKNKQPTKVRVGGQAVTVLKGTIIC
jgi:trans-2,3-dihydro-3-hydroxyanthranilate isomerase